jgi:capsule polysaccharide export protein KpsC/LpsZ
MDTAIEVFLHFKVVICVGIPMSWQSLANDQSIVFFKLGCLWFVNGFKLYDRHLVATKKVKTQDLLQVAVSHQY